MHYKGNLIGKLMDKRKPVLTFRFANIWAYKV